MFSTVTNGYRKMEWVVVIQMVLNQLNDDEKGNQDLARALVYKSWERHKDVLDGKRMKRPNKAVAGAFIVADNIDALGDKESASLYSLKTVFMFMLREVDNNREIYIKNATDEYLFTRSCETFERVAKELESDPISQQVSSFISE